MEYLNLLKNMFTYDLYMDKKLKSSKLSISNNEVNLDIDDIFVMKNYIIDDINNRGYEQFSIYFSYMNSRDVLKYKRHKYHLGISININDNKICLYTNNEIFDGNSSYTIDLSKYKEDKTSVHLVDEVGNVICSIPKRYMYDKDENDLFIKVLGSILKFIINNKLKI